MSYTPTTWTTGDTITATAMNKIEQGIANAGGGVYDGYDYVVRKVGDANPTLAKGNYSDLYDKLQDQDIVRGLYVENTTIGEYYDTSCDYVPLTRTYYYSSADLIGGGAKAVMFGGWKTICIEIQNDNSVSVTIVNG